MGNSQRMVLVFLSTTFMLLSYASALASSSIKVVEADEKMVESCNFLRTVTEKALLGTVNTAQKKVMKKATKLGATHVVFTEFESANAINFASAAARAYDCNKKGSKLKPKEPGIGPSHRLRAVDEAGRSKCEFLQSITKGAGGSGNPSAYTESAMNSALGEAVTAGADSYYLVDVETTNSGASVVLEALVCK